MPRLRMILGVLAAAFAAAPAQAQLRYVWSDLSGNLITQTTINGFGNTTTLRVYVQDQSAGATVFNSQGGLGNASVRVTGSTGNVSVTAGSPDIGAGGWELGDSNTSNPPNNVALNLFNLSAGRLPDASGRVLLGTVTLRGETEGQFTVTAADPNPQNGDVTLFLNGQTLDPLTLGNLTVFVTIVPEPATMLFVAAPLLYFAGRRRFGRRAIA